jgi:ribosomal protein S18 acetylase RimI-like enzyme
MTISILPFSTERAPLFDTLNRTWIEELFTLEQKDIDVLTQPQRTIIDKGGEIWFGAIGGQIVGACALIMESDGIMEFSKLGVDTSARGKGVARALLQHCKTRATERGAHTLRIYTNTKLAPANALYVSEGFEVAEMTPAQRQYYQRVDIMYDLPLMASAAQKQA